jgi:hypothetical protein
MNTQDIKIAQLVRRRALLSAFSDSDQQQALNDAEMLRFEKGGKKAQIGEIRTHAGKQMQKTENGWIPVKNTGNSSQKQEKHPGYKTDTLGTKRSFKDGTLHSFNDEPALITVDGHMVWSKNGKRHRDGDKPAIVYEDGKQEYYQNGKLHRESGPAVIHPDGAEDYYLKGKKVKADGQGKPTASTINTNSRVKQASSQTSAKTSGIIKGDETELDSLISEELHPFLKDAGAKIKGSFEDSDEITIKDASGKKYSIYTDYDLEDSLRKYKQIAKSFDRTIDYSFDEDTRKYTIKLK